MNRQQYFEAITFKLLIALGGKAKDCETCLHQFKKATAYKMSILTRR
jgi:hypothetical protein